MPYKIRNKKPNKKPKAAPPTISKILDQAKSHRAQWLHVFDELINTTDDKEFWTAEKAALKDLLDLVGEIRPQLPYQNLTLQEMVAEREQAELLRALLDAQTRDENLLAARQQMPPEGLVSGLHLVHRRLPRKRAYSIEEQLEQIGFNPDRIEINEVGQFQYSMSVACSIQEIPAIFEVVYANTQDPPENMVLETRSLSEEQHTHFPDFVSKLRKQPGYPGLKDARTVRTETSAGLTINPNIAPSVEKAMLQMFDGSLQAQDEWDAIAQQKQAAAKRKAARASTSPSP